MALEELTLPSNHRQVLDHFVSVCEADERISAAFLGGSYARGTRDEHSDLDLYVIATDEAYEEVTAERAAFVYQLGEALFAEDFGIPDTIFFILSNATEGEIAFARASDFSRIHAGPYKVLVDKASVLEGAVFSGKELAHSEQVESLRRQIYWFWHDLSHFTTALARGQLWWAYGQLGALRNYCFNLARLEQNSADSEVGTEGYFKIEQAVPVEQLSSLEATCGALEPLAMLKAARVILRYYKEKALALAQAHDIPYPTDLERIITARLNRVSAERLI